MKALILAGGEGRRLRPLTNDRPKPMIEVAGKPIIQWQIEWMKGHGINSFVISVGYMSDVLTRHFGTGSMLGVDISFIVEDEPLGTGGGIKNAKSILKDEEFFVATNGDVITNLDLGRMVGSSKELFTMALTPLVSTYGIVEMEKEKIVGFEEKPKIKDRWMNAGIYVMRKDVFDYLPDNGSLEKETFPKIAAKGMVDGMQFPESYWRSVDNFKDFEEVSADLKEGRIYGPVQKG